MKINFSFSGYVIGANISQVNDENGKPVNVDNLDPNYVLQKLNNGEFTISLGDHLYTNRKNEIELFDFDANT